MGIINTTSVITAVRLQEQGGDPAASGAGYQLLYVKAGGVYAINSAGAVVGPLTGDHGGLTGLADDDHTQYHNNTRGDARYPQLAHTHTGTTDGSKLAQANTHESADTDSATSSLHHTIGATATTAAAGNHTGPAFVGSGASHAAGHVPDPGVTGGTTKYLREDATWDVPPGSGTGHTIQDEGTPLTARANLNFVGAGVTATDDVGNNATVVTIPLGAGGAAPDGWVSDTNTWTYSSADDPTYVVSVNADMTGILGAGMRVKLTHSASVKYFIVTAVGNYSGGATLITLYGGTDYDLSASALSSPAYSTAKWPFGFPGNPSKWCVLVTDNVDRAVGGPGVNTWYNPNAANQIVVPIGIWIVTYKVQAYGYRNTDVGNWIHVTLSTANNSESDATWSTGGYSGHGGNPSDLGHEHYMSGIVSVANKTTLYLNIMWLEGATCTYLGFVDSQTQMVLSAVCAYL